MILCGIATQASSRPFVIPCYVLSLVMLGDMSPTDMNAHQTNLEPSQEAPVLNDQLSDQDVRAYVKHHQLDARVFSLDTPTPTVERSAEVLGTHPERIIKSLIFMAAGEPHVVIAAGLVRIDEKKLRDALGVSRKQLRLARPEEALAVSGYVIGSMPPFGHRRVLPTLLDSLSVPINTATEDTAKDVVDADAETTYYAGAGLVNAMMALSLQTLLAASGARAYPLSRPSSRP